MADLSAFPIAARWPPAHPDRLQLYSLNTPNGVTVSETGLRYEAGRPPAEGTADARGSMGTFRGGRA